MWLRIVAWILPAVVILQSVSDHATYIARIAQQLGQSDSGGGFPALLMFLWKVNGGGLSAIPLSVILMAACLLLDAHRRAYAGVHGWTVAGAPAPRYPNLTEAPPFVRALIVSVVALANFTWGDLAVTWVLTGDLAPGASLRHAGPGGHRRSRCAVCGPMPSEATDAGRRAECPPGLPSGDPGGQRRAVPPVLHI